MSDQYKNPSREIIKEAVKQVELENDKPDVSDILADVNIKLKSQHSGPLTTPISRIMARVKSEIAKTLVDPDNFEKLKFAMQAAFNEDPIEFLRRFEPMLRAYEQTSVSMEGKLPVRIILDKPKKETLDG